MEYHFGYGIFREQIQSLRLLGFETISTLTFRITPQAKSAIIDSESIILNVWDHSVKMKKLIFALIFLAIGIGIGFAAGVYTLPIIIELQSDREQVANLTPADEFDPTGHFDRDSPGSDALHWGEGTVRVSSGKLIFEDNVKFAPGPDYRIYLSKKYADTKSDFAKIKPFAIEIAKLRTFSGPLEFDLPATLNADEYDNVVVWCETFSMYIASARLE